MVAFHLMLLCSFVQLQKQPEAKSCDSQLIPEERRLSCSICFGFSIASQHSGPMLGRIFSDAVDGLDRGPSAIVLSLTPPGRSPVCPVATFRHHALYTRNY